MRYDPTIAAIRFGMGLAPDRPRPEDAQALLSELAEADLYQRRDLMPTEDVRAYAANVMGGLFGLGRRALEEVVFPGLRLDGGKRLLR